MNVCHDCWTELRWLRPTDEHCQDFMGSRHRPESAANCSTCIGQSLVCCLQMSGSEFVEAIVGVGAARIRDLFKRARVQKSACIIFVDEIDAVGLARARAGVQTNEEREQTLNQLLTEMDGVRKTCLLGSKYEQNN